MCVYLLSKYRWLDFLPLSRTFFLFRFDALCAYISFRFIIVLPLVFACSCYSMINCTIEFLLLLLLFSLKLDLKSPHIYLYTNNAIREVLIFHLKFSLFLCVRARFFFVRFCCYTDLLYGKRMNGIRTQLPWPKFK